MKIWNTTQKKLQCGYIKYILENKKYIEIGINKYNQKFDVSIKTINDLLDLNILSESLVKIEKKIEELEGIKYIWVTEEISSLGENLSSIVLEEKDPILPKLRAYERELDEER